MRLSVLIAAGWLVALAAPARAQESIEPFLTLSADGRYDDYVPGGGDGFVARVAPGAGVRIHTHRLVLRLDSLAAYDRYERTERPVPDTWNALGNLGLDYAATRRLQLHVADHFADVRDPRELDRIGIVTPPGVQIIDDSAEAKATWTAARGVWLDTGYGFRTTRFSDAPDAMGNLQPVPGGDEHALTAGLSVQPHQPTILRVDYRSRFFVVGPGAQAQEPTLGFWHKLTRTLAVDGEGGPVVYDDPRGTAVTWHARGGVLADWRHLRLMASYDRDLVGGTGATAFIDPTNMSAGVIWAEFLAGTARWRPVRWLDVSARADYFRNGLAPDSVVLVDGYDASGEVTFRLARSFELAGYYAYRQQYDRAAGGMLGFQRDLVGLRITALWAPTNRIEKEATEEVK